MIAEILPGTVCSAFVYDDPTDTTLFPEEQAAVARAVDKRRREFTTGRLCARNALTGLGLPAGPILPLGSGAPRWPVGVVGSITHCTGYRAAAVAWRADVWSLGIDAEVDHALPYGVLDSIALPIERTAIEALPRSIGPSWDRLLFSAKESVYKAWHPVTGRGLEFEDVMVSIDAIGGRFAAHVLIEPAPFSSPVFHGRWTCRRGIIATSVVSLRGRHLRARDAVADTPCWRPPRP